MRKLDNKIAIITGSARGIGEAIATHFVKNGACVVIADVLEKEGQKLAKMLGDKAIFVRHDVTDSQSWDNVVTETEKHFGGLNVLVNNAGIIRYQAIYDLTEEDIKQTLNVNLYGPIIGTRCFARHMRDKKRAVSSIVNISSADGLTAHNALGAYVASKWGIRGFTKAAAVELGLHGICVNSIHPGAVYTLLTGAVSTREQYDSACLRYAAQRACEVEEVAQAVLFFASDDSRYCMGSELAVDGGMSAGQYFYELPGAPDRGKD